MSYVQQTIKAGDVVEVRKYYDWNHGRAHRKQPRTKCNERSSERQAEYNKRQAIDRLRWKLNAGCEAGDYHITLTYSGDAPAPEEASKHLRNYLARLRRLYTNGGHTFQWLAVTEFQNKRIHHHLILKQGPELMEIIKRWKYGRPKVVMLDNTGQYADLAEYLVKETDKTFRDPECKQKKRWSCSRNWPEPVITKKVIKASKWNESPKALKGYVLEDEKTYQGFTEDGYPFIFYSMVSVKRRKE